MKFLRHSLLSPCPTPTKKPSAAASQSNWRMMPRPMKAKPREVWIVEVRGRQKNLRYWHPWHKSNDFQPFDTKNQAIDAICDKCSNNHVWIQFRAWRYRAVDRRTR